MPLSKAKNARKLTLQQTLYVKIEYKTTFYSKVLLIVCINLKKMSVVEVFLVFIFGNFLIGGNGESL